MMTQTGTGRMISCKGCEGLDEHQRVFLLLQSTDKENPGAVVWNSVMLRQPGTELAFGFRRRQKDLIINPGR